MKYGRYEIIKELGKGSMGVVYLARDPHIDRLVALKVLRPDRVSSEGFMQRFLKEAKVIGRLSHPNIVLVYDIGEDHGTAYIAMEYLEGMPLDQAIEKQAPTTQDVIAIGISVAETLDYAHHKGIVHRDVKPSNIIVLPDKQVKLTDFSIAHIEDPEATLQTQAGEILGTPAYMSPEQVLGQMVDGRSDLFSLGVVLYELATGERPFKGEGVAAIFRAITTVNPIEIVKLKPQVPQHLSRIIMKSLAKEPEERYSNGNDLAEALEACCDGITAQQKTVISLPHGSKKRSNGLTPASKKKSRSSIRALVVLIAILVAAGLGGTTFKFFGAKKPGVPAGSLPPGPAPVEQPYNRYVPVPESSAPVDSGTKSDLKHPADIGVSPSDKLPGPELKPEPAPPVSEELAPPAKSQATEVKPELRPPVKEEPSPHLQKQPAVPQVAEETGIEPVPAPEDWKTRRIEDLLAKAKAAYDKGDILTPEETSAVRYYKEVFALDDRETNAYEGIIRAIQKYMEWARRGVSEGKVGGRSNLSSIRQCLEAIPEALKNEHGEEIEDVNKEIRTLSSRFDALEAQAQKAAAKKKSPAPRKMASQNKMANSKKEDAGKKQSKILIENMTPEPKILNERM